LYVAAKWDKEAGMYGVKVFGKSSKGAHHKEEIRRTIGQWNGALKAGGVRNEKAYTDNIKGIHQDLEGPTTGQLFIQIDNAAHDAVLLGKMKEWKTSVDLSEIVKHWKGGQGPVEALMGWAAKRYVKVTLTAAYCVLVRVYSEYGFECEKNDRKEAVMLPYQRWCNYQRLLDMQRQEVGKGFDPIGIGSSFDRRANIITEMRKDIFDETGKKFDNDAAMLEFVKAKVIELGETPVNMIMTMTKDGHARALQTWPESAYWQEL
jgi:hypothetical protein